MTADDRRRSARVRVAAVASMQTFGSMNANNQALGTVRDLSRTGIGLETGQPPMSGQCVTLRIAIDDQIHEIQTRATRVVRRGNSHFFEVGLDWAECSPEELAFLDGALAMLEDEPLGQ
jgi:hypothetical protein